MSVTSTNIPGYELVRELGSGGMANVYLAIQRSLDRKVALKVMKRNIEDLEKFEKRFLMEGRTMAKLPHRNIVAVYDIVKSEDATYIAMEYLDGGTLSIKMKEGLSLAEAISVVVQIGQALQFAHEHGIVHRDLKPANIMFRDPATPVLTDFGIARQQDASATRLTQTGMLVGTPTYMSPEQINALEVDGRSDLYSLGVLFYELLTGQPPFAADTPIAVLMAHLTSPVPPLPDQFGDFQPVIDKMLAKSREDRFASLKEFTRALKAAVVHNQNLWARLQADPNQSSSEQLRALGFSVSGGDMMQSPSGNVRLPPAGSGQIRTPTPRPTPVPGQGPAGSRPRSSGAIPLPDTGDYAPPPRKPPWLWIGAGGAAVVLAVVAALFWPEGDIDPVVRRSVDILLAQADEAILKKDLLKAAEMVQLSREQAPKYEAVIERTTRLVGAFKEEAQTAIRAGDFDTATARIGQGRLVAPEDAELAALEKQIEAARLNAAQAKEIAAVLARADQASRQGRDFGADGAYAILVDAKTKAPNNAEVAQRLDALIERALKPTRDALTRREYDAAARLIRVPESALAGESKWKTLKAEVDKAIEVEAARVRLLSVLTNIDRQIQERRLVAPPGDNAQETLARVLAMDPKNPDVLRRQEALAAALTAQAQAALSQGQVEAALQNANLALNVKPDYANALNIKRSAEGRLDAARARVIEALGSAQKALAEARYLSPPNDNARALLEAVLKLDPNNAEAKELLAGLPKRIGDAARERLAAGDLDAAARLVNDGRRAYPADADLVTLALELQQQQSVAQAKAQRVQKLERISELVALRPLKPETLGEAAREIVALLRADPRDVDALTLKQRLLDLLGDSLRAASAVSDVDTIAAVLRPVQQAFGDDVVLAKLATDLESTRTRIANEEAARLAAISGELVLNAYPWATVDSVVDANRKPVKLPADATTPLRLTLPAGVYNVTFSHPQAGRSTQVAQVEAKKSVATTASFAARVTAKDYLRRAGW
jgi:serine/threonine protein kinase